MIQLKNYAIPTKTMSFNYGTVQAQVYTRARVKSRALACRGVRALRVLGKNLTRENQRYVRPCVSLVYR